MKQYAEGDVMKKENRIIIKQLELMKVESTFTKEMLSLTEQLLENARRDGDTYSEVVSLYYTSLYYYKTGNMELSLKPVTLANELSEKNKFLNYYVITSNLLGVIYNSISEEFWGLEYLLKGFYVSKDMKNDDLTSRILNNIGDMFHELGDYKEAYNYLIRAKEYREKVENYKDDVYSTIVMNLIENAILLEKDDEVISYMEDIEPTLSNEDREILRAIIVSKEVIYSFGLGDISKAKEGIQYLLERVLKYTEYTHAFNALMRVRQVIFQLGDRKLGDTYINVLKMLAQDIDDVNYTAKYQDILVEYYEVIGDKQQWHEALEEYYRFNHENVITRKNNFSKSLIAKIELERAVHEHYEILKRNRILEILSEVDDLTGVYNRRTLEKRVFDSLAEVNDSFYAMLIIDVDHFKIVNDSHGHILGDKLLRKMGTLLKESFHENSIVGRIGGDEFVVFIDHIGTDLASAIKNVELQVENFQEKVRKVKLSDKQSILSVSIGITVEKDRKKSFKFLYSNADTALYEAKNRGRNCYVYHEV